MLAARRYCGGVKKNVSFFKYTGIFSCIFVMNAVCYTSDGDWDGFGQFVLVTFVVKLGDMVC